ncbi:MULTISPECIES: hypothetical protein [unclassified Pseudomonas]|uniref:hypothetical protein n=1 Tax=unclassified Pseudomonas TaxID=196821 RepID=UPI000D3780A5|nr:MULTISPECIES: hypothetical protein [unclassified Pseudomonas]RAU40347.1 hypothetical protein DBP26_024650 [Pseudomonas sp. RIT 409]RAU55496.1 hypothetical protein DBY65_006235 [Pseudomonas sp. RIT 412]
MTAFHLKLLITPLLMLSISLAAKRWGTHIGGLLSGLPVTSASIMLFLGLEQGPTFVGAAAPGALAGVAAIQAAYLFYFAVSARTSVVGGCVLALGVYALVAWLMNRWAGPMAAVAITLFLVAMIVSITAPVRNPGTGRYVPTPRWIIPMRMLTATALLLAITATAQWAGPVVSGFLAPIPVIAWPLAVFAHVQGGRHELAAIVRGNAIGAIGVIGFYLTLQALVLQWGVVLTVGAGVVLAVALTAFVAKVAPK